MITTAITGKNGPGAHQLNATSQSSRPAPTATSQTGTRRRRSAADPAVDRRVLVPSLGDRGPGEQVGEDAGAAEERRGREQHAEQHRVDAEVLAEAAGDAGADAVGAAAAQPRGWRSGRRQRVMRRGLGRGHGGNDAARTGSRAHRGGALNSTLSRGLRGAPDALRAVESESWHGDRRRTATAAPPTAPRARTGARIAACSAASRPASPSTCGVRARLAPDRASSLLAAAGGLGVALYGAYWIVLPTPPGAARPACRPGSSTCSARVAGARRDRRSSRRRCRPAGLFVPTLLACLGGALIWRQASDADRDRLRDAVARLAGGRARPSGSAGCGIVAGVALVAAGAVLVLARAELLRDPRRRCSRCS